MANLENQVLTVYSILDQGFQEGKLMYVAGKEDAEKGDLGTIVLPKPAPDVQIDPLLPDPVVFSYSNTENNVIGLREVLAKIDSDAAPLRPSTCTVSVLVPAVDDTWAAKCQDVSLVLDNTGTIALRNPHGLAQYGEWLYFIDYESQLIITVEKSLLESQPSNNTLKVASFINLVTVAGLQEDAKGQAIIALGDKIYALYIRANPQATQHQPGVLIRLDINTSTGALSYTPTGTTVNNKTTVGRNPQSIIPVSDGTNTHLLIPAIGGPQNYEGETNGVASNICVVQADAALWPNLSTGAPAIITGDPYPPPSAAKTDPTPSAASAYDIHAIGAAMRGGSSAMFILTQVYTDEAKAAFWMLYETTVGAFLGIAPNTTLGTALSTGALELRDQGLIQTPDPQVSDDIYFWDILYEQTTDEEDDTKDRLWLVLGSPFLITKAEAYGSSSTPDANPFVMFSSFGGINVNSVDLTIETLHQAQREVSLKRGVRSSKLGAAAAKAARATTSMSAEEGEEEDK